MLKKIAVRFWPPILLALSAVTLFFFGWLGDSIKERFNLTKECECIIMGPQKAINFEDNLESIAKVSIGQVELKQLYVTKIMLFNRTNENFKDFQLIITPNNLSATDAKLVHKVVLYPERYSGGLVSWDDKAKDNRLILSFSKFDVSWDDGLTIKLFYDKEFKPGISLSTPAAGVKFVPFNSQSERWYFFGLDNAIKSGFFMLVGAIGCLAFLILREFIEKRKKQNLNCCYIRL